jgi:hypothetical protein
MTIPSDHVDDVAGELLPEYRPAWEIHIAWEIRMEDGVWQRVTGRINAHSKVPEYDDRVAFLLGDDAQCLVEASTMLMCRYVPGPPVPVRDLTAAEVDQVKADFRHQPQG